MTTGTENTESQKSVTIIDEIWNNLKFTDKNENRFQFSTFTDRHIVVLYSHKIKNSVVADIIRGDTYGSCNHLKHQPQKTITYVMVDDDTAACDICIINLIDIPPLEHFLHLIKKHSYDSSLSPMAEVDKAIYAFATNIDLFLLVCKVDDFELMINMRKWASDRAHVMALVFIVKPNFTSEEREELLVSIRQNKEFQANDLQTFFEKGIFCVSDLSYDDFENTKEQNTAQKYVEEWRSKFLRHCIGGSNNQQYEIKLCDEKQSRNVLPCRSS